MKRKHYHPIEFLKFDKKSIGAVYNFRDPQVFVSKIPPLEAPPLLRGEGGIPQW